MKLPVLLTLCSNRYSRSLAHSMSTTKPPRTITLVTPSGCPAQLSTLVVFDEYGTLRAGTALAAAMKQPVGDGVGAGVGNGVGAGVVHVTFGSALSR
jgi:hypothetical protein